MKRKKARTPIVRISVNLNPRKLSHRQFEQAIKEYADDQGISISSAIVYLTNVGLATVQGKREDLWPSDIISATATHTFKGDIDLTGERGLASATVTDKTKTKKGEKSGRQRKTKKKARKS